MKTIVTVESFDEMSERKLERARRLDRREPVPAERRITFEAPEDMAAFLTANRVTLLKAAIQQPRSVTELAEALQRNRTAVSRDVRALREKGMLKLRKQPNPGHGQIQVVHAAARQFDFRARIGL